MICLIQIIHSTATQFVVEGSIHITLSQKDSHTDLFAHEEKIMGAWITFYAPTSPFF